MIATIVILATALAVAVIVIAILWTKLAACRANDDLERRFAALAAQTLALNSEHLRQQNINGLSQVLAPVRQDLEAFRRSVADCYTAEARERFALDKRISELLELNNMVGRETRRLTDALKGNSKLQGDWGELVLDNILEQAGLRRGVEYTVQDVVVDEQGRLLRPDVIINYTEGRKIVVDSKVSIQDYINMLNASTDDERSRYARAHLASVKKHVAELKNKSYQDMVGRDRFDYVLMFIPHEGAFLAAMNLDVNLWQTAADSRVLIISPTHLMAVVKLIEQMWRHDKQNQNALAIADQAGKMLDKLRLFLEDLDHIDKSITQAREAWNSAFSKLTGGPGNLIARAQKLHDLGARAKKPLPGRYTADDDTDTEL